MIVTFTPGPGDVQRWDFDPDQVRQSQAELIEKRYGRNWDAFLADVRGGSARARRVLLWHLLRITHHTLRYEDTPDFAMGDLKVEHSIAELIQLRERVLKANVPEEEREQVLTALDIEISEGLSTAEGDDEDQGDDAEGKASEPAEELPPS